MKKAIFSGCIILVLASMVFVSYAEMKKTVISKSNLADLKGKWVGSRTAGSSTKNTDLEISSDRLPIRGKFTFYDFSKRGRGGTTTETFDFVGEINDQGNLVIKSPNVELSLYKDDGKMRLEGPSTGWTGRGIMSFSKK
jgi:hypothetical protein